MTFPGELLHGVVPTACAAAGQGAAAAQPRQRLTLLIAWYSEATQRAVRHRSRAGNGPQSAMPRPTRSQTWPASLQCPAQAAAAAASAAPPAAVRLPVPEASPAWAEIAPGEAGGEAGGGAGGGVGGGGRLEVPAGLQQHFFLRRPDDVRARLFEEHGLGGSWAAEGAPARKRRREGARDA